MNNLQFQPGCRPTPHSGNGVASARPQSLIVSSSLESQAPSSRLHDVASHSRFFLYHHAVSYFSYGTTVRRRVLGCGVRRRINGRFSARAFEPSVLCSHQRLPTSHIVLADYKPVASCPLPPPLSTKARFGERRPLPSSASIRSEP